MRSLTGFGAGEAALGAGRITVELRSVNHRHLEVRTRLSRELLDHQALLEQLVRERVRRGRVDAVARCDGAVAPPVELDLARARSVFAALERLRDELAPGAEVPLSLLSLTPDLFGAASATGGGAVKAALEAATRQALDALAAMSQAEGQAIARDLAGRHAVLRTLVADLQARTADHVEQHRTRLRERLGRLLGPDAPALDAGRLEQEVALLADRSDVTEELTRLGSHLDQLAGLLGPGGDDPGPGRRIDFLLQEMLREANTLSAKAQDASVSQSVVSVKVELERIREQVQNVE